METVNTPGQDNQPRIPQEDMGNLNIVQRGQKNAAKQFKNAKEMLTTGRGTLSVSANRVTMGIGNLEGEGAEDLSFMKAEMESYHQFLKEYATTLSPEKAELFGATLDEVEPIFKQIQDLNSESGSFFDVNELFHRISDKFDTYQSKLEALENPLN